MLYGGFCFCHAGENLRTRWVCKAEDPPEMGGLYVGRNPRPCRPAVTLLHERSGKGIQRFVTLLCPVRSDAGPLIRKVEKCSAEVTRIFFTDGRMLDISILQDEKQNIRWEWKKE